MNEAIRLAIEKGGYQLRMKSGTEVYLDTPQGKWKEIAEYDYLDPEFWRCLGKALGWPKEQHEDWQYAPIDSCLYHWHRFIDWIADGKSPDEFFTQLLKDSPR